MNKGYDIAIVKITAYEWWYAPMRYSLCFAPTLKNVGDAPFGGMIGYTAVAINLRNNEIEDIGGDGITGGLQPGEEWYYEYGAGLEFDSIYFPTVFSLQFTATPTDSNPENNYAEGKYLIWSSLGLFFPPQYFRIHIPKTMVRSKACINTPFQLFLQNHPNMFPILRHLLGL